MNEPFVIRIFIKLIHFLTPVLETLAIIFCLPQLILKYMKLNFINRFDFRNYIQLTTHFVFYIIYILTYLNFHFIFFFKHYLGVDSHIQLILAWFVINAFTAIIYKLLDMKFFVFKDLPYLLFLSSYEILWILILVFFIITFGKLELLNFLSFKRIFEYNMLGFIGLLSFFFFEALIPTINSLFSHMLILLHVINPISFIRALYIVNNQSGKDLLRISIYSSFLIIQDFLLLVALVINLVFTRSFIKSFINLCFDIYNTKFKEIRIENLNNGIFNEFNFKTSIYEKEISYSYLYLYIKHVFILKNFYKNVKILISFIIFTFTLIFIWRIKNTIKIFIEFLKNEDLKEFIIDSALNIVNGIFDIIYPIIWIYNHIIPFNYFSLKKIENYYQNYFINEENKNRPELSSEYLNVFIIINKGFDYLITVLGLSSIFNFVFIIYLLRAYKFNKFGNVKLFSLLSESEYFIENGIEESKTRDEMDCEEGINNSLSIYSKYLSTRRVRLILYTLCTNVENLFLLITLPTILDPFYGLRYIKNIYVFLSDSFNKNLRFSKLDDNFQHKMIKNIMISFLNIIFYIPANIILALTAPWCIFEFGVYVFKYSFLKQILKIKNYSTENSKSVLTLDEINTKINNKKEFNISPKISNHTKLMLKKWIKGWILVLEFVTVHISIIRAVLLWREFFFLKNYHQLKTSTFTSQQSQDEIQSDNNSDGIQNINSLSLTRKPFRRQLSKNTEIFLRNNSHSIFKFLLKKHFSQLLSEFIFYPFIFLFIFSTPWSIFRMKEFFTEKIFIEKSRLFFSLCKEFIKDIYTFISLIAVMLSMVNSLQLLILLYYSFKKNFIRDQNSIIQYGCLFKNDFRTELSYLSSGIFKKLLIFFFICVDIVLLSRIIPLFRRLKRFVVAKFARDVSKFKHMFDSKIQVDHHLIHKLSNTVFVSISQYLAPDSIYRLSVTNKDLYNKTQVNLVWRYQYENYYKMKLKDSSSPEVFNLLNTDNFENYKTACNTAASFINNKIELTEDQRDSLIGVFNVVVEETVESFLKLPHLILIPVKIISIGVKFIKDVLFKYQIKFMKSNFAYVYLIKCYPDSDFVGLYNLDENLEKKNIYNLQIIGLVSLFEILCLIVANIVLFIFCLFVLITKLISTGTAKPPRANFNNNFNFENNNNNNNIIEFTYQRKIENINNNYLVIYQYLLTLIFLSVNLFLIFYPYYYLHQEGFNNIFSQNFSSHASLLIPNNYFQFIIDLCWTWWAKGFFGRIYFFFRSLICMSILLYINGIIIYLLKSLIFNTSNVIIYDLLFFIFIPENGLIQYLFSNIKVVTQLLYPQVIILKLVNKFVKEHNTNNIAIGCFNILIFVVIVYPFYLNFRITWSFFNLFMLNIYAITNLIKVIKTTSS